MTANPEVPIRLWACPSCSVKDRTQGSHTQMHGCGALGGLTVPLVEVQHLDDRPDARHIPVEREDYLGGDWSSLAAVRTDHGDGSNDCTVYPQTAVTRVRYGDLEMAWTTSKVFAYAQLQMMENNVKPSSDSYKVALYSSNTMTPDNTVSTAVLTEYAGAASQWVTGNENSGTGYTAGGVAVTPVTVTQTTNVITFTSSGSPQWTTATITAYGCLVYDTTVSNEGICFNYFGGVQTVTAGTFTIAWNASGIATWTC